MRLLSYAFVILFMNSAQTFADTAASEPKTSAFFAQLFYKGAMLITHFNAEALIEKNSHIKINSCSVQTNTAQVFTSDDIGACLVQDYIEQRFDSNDRAISVFYTFDSKKSHFNLYWKPNFDRIGIEIKKIETYLREFKKQKSMCVTKAHYTSIKDQTLAHQKYLKALQASSSREKMHSTLGDIKVIFEQPADLQNILGVPPMVAQLLHVDQVSQAEINLVLDPDDFGNMLAKIDVLERAAILPMYETYFQIKVNFSCNEFNLEVDPSDEN